MKVGECIIKIKFDYIYQPWIEYKPSCCLWKKVFLIWKQQKAENCLNTNSKIRALQWCKFWLLDLSHGYSSNCFCPSFCCFLLQFQIPHLKIIQYRIHFILQVILEVPMNTCLWYEQSSKSYQDFWEKSQVICLQLGMSVKKHTHVIIGNKKWLSCIHVGLFL